MGDKPPVIPSVISSDGREIWEWAGKLSAHTSRLHKMRELRAEIARQGTVCGDCDKWMKSSQCPREVNVNGRRRGAAMNDRICGQFMEDRFTTEHRENLKAKLAALEAVE